MTENETMPIRLYVESVNEARIAAAARGISLTKYASQVLIEAARRDIDAWSKARAQAPARKPKGGAK